MAAAECGPFTMKVVELTMPSRIASTMPWLTFGS